MAKIPDKINKVKVEFKSSVGKTVTKSMLKGLKSVIETDVATGHKLKKIYISSASDSHPSKSSRHYMKKAVDISRINGKRIFTYYSTNATVKEIVKAIQTTFENYSGRRENFGPYLKKKSGKKYKISKHKDHIHLSVD